jgi:hypothetical protein
VGADDAGADTRRAWTIVAFATAGFFALLVFALGMASLLTGDAVIDEPGLGPVPGIIGTIAALGGFVAVTAPALLRGGAGVGQALGGGAAGAAAYCTGVLVGGVAIGTDPLRALAIAGAVLLSWVSVTIAVAGILAGAGAAVAARSGPGVPRWPWERDDEDR